MVLEKFPFPVMRAMKLESSVQVYSSLQCHEMNTIIISMQNTSIVIVMMVIFNLLEVLKMKAGLKFATTTNGEQYVITAGIQMILKLCVINLVTLD